MDRRLAERRQRVAEERARGRLSRLLRVLVVLATASFVVWLLQSPFLSVAAIEIAGASEVDVEGVLSEVGVVVGRPMVLIDASEAEERLAEEAWIDEARVARDWPTTIAVQVSERVPAATVRLGEDLWLASADGTLLESADRADSSLGLVDFPGLDAGDADSLDVIGAVEYVSALSTQFRPGSRVMMGEEGLEAVVGGFTVRLGGPFEMASKAKVTEAVILSEPESGSILTVVSPASPAVLPPDQQGTPTTTTP